MLPFAFYLIKVVICSGILFGYYWLMLRNKIYHRYNRFYLLATAALSLLMPLVQINILHRVDAPAPGIKLLQVVTGSGEYLDEIVLTARKSSFTAEQFLMLFYLLTSVVFLSLFIQVLLKIRTLLKQHEQTVVDKICFVNTTAKGTPFSFLKYVFWNDNIDITTTTGNQIFKHELAHVQQKHSHDKLFINSLLILFWCNPFFWLIRKELNMIHEFMADKIAVEDSNTEAFAAMILQATYPQHRFALTNPFFYSPIKRRLLMLTKNKNPKASYIGRILVLPLAVILFAAFTLKTKMIKNSTAPAYEGKKITVVIDAGHGGVDFGGRSLDGSILEKDLALAIVKKIKSINNNGNINIILTRDNDIYQSPKEKADFSNEKNADLLISIHIDAATHDAAATKTGMSVWVAKNNFANVGNSKLLASAILGEFANDYKIPVPTLPAQRQLGIWLIQASNCPAVLIEAGYITNKQDLAYMQSEEGQEAIAKNVLAAIEKYANSLNGGKGISDTIPTRENSSSNKTTPKEFENLMSSGKQMYCTKEGIILITDSVYFSKPSEENDFNINTGLIIINNKKYDKTILKEKYIQSKKISFYSSNSPEAIEIYGDDAIPGAIIFEDAVITDTKPFTYLTFKDAKKSSPVSKKAILKSDEKIFTQVENEARFPGGEPAWRRYLEMHLNPSVPLDDRWRKGTYEIIVSFKVNKDGSIEDIKTDKYHGSKTADECINLIKKGPRWVPALQNGHNVTSYKKQPITFVVQEE